METGEQGENMRKIEIKRDPFARAELVRYTRPKADRTPKGCHWCGNAPDRFIYQWESDGFIHPTSPFPFATLAFCSLSCFQSFND